MNTEETTVVAGEEPTTTPAPAEPTVEAAA